MHIYIYIWPLVISEREVRERYDGCDGGGIQVRCWDLWRIAENPVVQILDEVGYG